MIFPIRHLYSGRTSFQAMDDSDAPRRALYLLSIWCEGGDEAHIWHGFLETAARQRLAFNTLAELNQLLCELGGWIDPPLLINPAARELD